MNFRQWQGFKQSANQFGDNKNTPGTDYAPKGLVIEESDNIPCNDEPATTPSEPTVGDFEPPTAS